MVTVLWFLAALVVIGVLAYLVLRVRRRSRERIM
jgi:hypothetical protein